ncbi:MAG: PilZ domain-containing protein [Methylomonas sp.]|nr:PilZ domain-containing protein [Methylomonas sp.]
MTERVERSYRKMLGCEGLIYIGYQEHPIRVVNLSLSGLLAELNDASPVHVKSIFKSIQISPLVDIYLPKLRVAGEAEVVRAEEAERCLQIAVEFRNLTYDIDDLLYRRRAYRKNMTAHGQIIITDEVYAFDTENVSVDGLMASLSLKVEVQPGSIVHFSFKHLELQGEGQVIWVEQGPASTLLGLKYLHLERDSIPGVPHFINR